MNHINVKPKLIQKNVWGKMDDLEFIDFICALKKNICQHIVDSVDDVDMAKIRADYDTPVEFTPSVIHDTISSEILEDNYGYLQSLGGNF